jgi:predicted flavoprotein YhiN
MKVLIKDITIIGAGASGMMSAYFCSEWGKEVAVLDHNKQIGRKILISGGGKCNFTNKYGEAKHYYSNNPHFVKSALSRYSGFDFLELIKDHNVEVEERKIGQLLCAKSAK